MCCLRSDVCREASGRWCGAGRRTDDDGEEAVDKEEGRRDSLACSRLETERDEGREGGRCVFCRKADRKWR